jgi:chromosome partitioning protein
MEQGKRVLAVDLDPQGNLTMSQGWNPDEIERSMFDVLVHKLPITEIVRNSEIDVAVSSIDLAGAELALASMIGRERALEKAFTPILSEYDYILIDTPPSLGLLTINALVASNGVIVPVQCEYLSLRGLVQLENTLTMIRENLNPHVAIQGILPTMYDKRLLHSREAVEILKENFGDLVLNTKIRKTVRYAEAPVKGMSVLKYDPSGEAAGMYRDLAKEVLDGASARQHA